MMALWLLLHIILLWGWAETRLTTPLLCKSCQGDVEPFSCPQANVRESYVVRTLPDDIVQIQCPTNTSNIDYSVIQECNFSYFIQFEFVGCPLPNTSFADVFLNLGGIPGNVSSLSFISGHWEASGGLQEWHVDGLTNLRTLQFIDNGFTSIPPALLTNTPRMKFIRFIGNNLESLPHTLFARTPELVMVDIGNNNLSSLPNDLFIDLPELTNVSCWNNMLTNVENNIFSKIENLRYLDLRDNIITTIGEDFFRGMKQLEGLHLGGNKLKTLPAGLLSELRALEKLELQSNMIESLPRGSFDTPQKLEVIILRNNSLTHLPDGIFEKCGSLERLDLSYNNLQYLSDSMFPPRNSKLKYIDLGNNNISFSKSFDSEITFSNFPLGNQLELTEVLLANNRIEDFPQPFNFKYLQLKTIDLSGNKIRFIDLPSMRFFFDSVTLNLKNNQIQVINMKHLKLMSEEKKKVVKLYLEGNPLLCNCILYNIADIAQNAPHETDMETLQILVQDAEKASCINFDNEIEILSEVDTKKLECKIDECFDRCSCSWRAYDEMILINCSFRGLETIPDADIFLTTNFSVIMNLMNNSISTLEGLQHPFYNRLVGLSLANNKVSHINETDLPKNLKEVNLSGNNLTNLSEPMLKHLSESGLTVSLGKNPWVCNCDMLEFLNFLKVSYEKVLDQDSITCPDDDAPLHDYTEHAICPFFMKPMVIVTIVLITVFLLLFAVLGTFSFYKYKQGIKVWLFTHRMCLWAITEDELDADKKYDAFISYSHKDEEFVNTVLVPGLESGDPKYRICLHYRDWIPGEYIQNQIMQSVEASRRTIVVLSPNFIESVWGQLEFKAAHSQALQDRTNRIIVIVYGQVPPESELDEKLRLYISMKTYVKWGDARFWEKLRYIMPHPQEFIQKKKNQTQIENVELGKTA